MRLSKIRKFCVTELYLSTMVVCITGLRYFTTEPKNAILNDSKAYCMYEKYESKEETIFNLYKSDVNEGNAYKLLSALDVEHKDIVLAQMIIESGHFKSGLARSNNNFFGMKMPRKRKTTALKEHNGYAFYDSWVSSVQDYVLWQDNYASGLDRESFLRKLSSYAEDENYREKIELVIKNIKYYNL